MKEKLENLYTFLSAFSLIFLYYFDFLFHFIYFQQNAQLKNAECKNEEVLFFYYFISYDSISIFNFQLLKTIMYHVFIISINVLRLLKK